MHGLYLVYHRLQGCITSTSLSLFRTVMRFFYRSVIAIFWRATFLAFFTKIRRGKQEFSP